MQCTWCQKWHSHQDWLPHIVEYVLNSIISIVISPIRNWRFKHSLLWALTFLRIMLVLMVLFPRASTEVRINNRKKKKNNPWETLSMYKTRLLGKECVADLILLGKDVSIGLKRKLSLRGGHKAWKCKWCYKVRLRLQQPKINWFLAERHKCNCEIDIPPWPGPRQYVAFRGLINVIDVICEIQGGPPL